MEVGQSFEEDIRRIAPVLLKLGVLPEPPAEPPVHGRAYPLAVDVHGRIGAVSFAVFDLHPDVEPGWWCLVRQYALRDGRWQDAAGEADAFWSQEPFDPPEAPEDSDVSWIDRGSCGGVGEWDDEPRRRHVLFGIAMPETASLSVCDDSGAERHLAINPWCGAFVAIVAGATSRLTGYAPGGAELGSLAFGTA